ncbi:MAG: response regulator transcription factor [Candidatus Promineifilaceae bacterium]
MREAVIVLIEGRGVGERSLRPPLLREVDDVARFHTSGAALAWLREHSADLFVFDASSMRSNGVQSCRQLRQALPNAPFIYCFDQERGGELAAGADSYLARPFTARKLLNRIRALLPSDDLKEEIVRAGPITFYLSKRSVVVGRQAEKRLTPKLAQLLEKFLRHPNEVIARQELMRQVWDTSYFGDTRTLDVHMRWLREVIEEDPARPRFLRTVRGIGYIFSIQPAKTG